MPFFLVGHYLWMRRGDLRARRFPRPPLAFVAMLVLGPDHLLRALAVAVERAGRAHARLRQPPPAARALQLRVPRPQLEQPADDHRAQAAPRDGAVRRDRVHRARDDAGAGGGRRGGAGRGGAADEPVAPTAVPRRAPAAGDDEAELAPPGRRRRSRAGRVPAGADARAAGRARRAVDADLRRRQALHDRRCRTWPCWPGSASPADSGARGASLPAARARLRARRAGGARGARLPARRRRDAALAPRRPLALQPARGRLRGGRVAGDEPAVLGLFRAADAGRDQSRRARESCDVLARRHPRCASTCTSATDAWRSTSATPASARRRMRRSQLGILFYEKHWAIYEGWFWESYGTTKPCLVREREGRSAGDDVPARSAVTATEPAAHGAPAAAAPADAPAPALAAAVPRAGAAPLVVYLVFAAPTSAPRAAGCASHSPYNHYVYLADGWLHGRLALRRPAAERERLGEGRRAQAARRARGARHLRQPHRRADRSLLSAARHAGDDPGRRHRVAVVDSLRVVPAVPGGADGAVRRHLGAVVQRRAVHGAVGRR